MSKDRRKVKRDLNRLIADERKIAHAIDRNFDKNQLIKVKDNLTEKNCCRYFGWF